MSIDNLFNIKNKVIVVTGSSQGIGLEIAKSLARYGAIVHGISRTNIVRPQYNYHYGCDMTHDINVKNTFKSIFYKSKKIDVLINNAGITLPNSSMEKAYENFDKTLSINLKAIYHSALVCSKYMKKIDKCSIINISSLASLFAFPGNLSYLASKGGLKSLSKGLALDLAKKHIRVNCIVPEYIKTNKTMKSYNNLKDRKLRSNRTMNNKWGKPKDLV